MVKTSLIENLIIAAAIIVITGFLPGCAQMFSSKTQVAVLHNPDGTCQASYSSDKEQQGLEAEVCGGKIKVDKSGTMEAVVAASAATQASLARILEALAPLIPAAAKAGALAGS